MRLPARISRAVRRLGGRMDPVILMYHRVADVAVDPWELAVSPRHFAEQMAVLRRDREPVPLDWLVREIVAGRRPARAVAVTFDDGYLDVLGQAKPILDRNDVPATLFLTTGTLGSAAGFWWDRLASIVFATDRIPAGLALSFADAPDTTDRERFHLCLWRAIRLLGPQARERALDELARALGRTPREDAPIMSDDEARALAADGRVTLGAHSVTHPSLPSLSEDAQRAEMAESKRRVEEIAGTAIKRFAYPFGDFDERSARLAREIGFEFAVSTEPGAATSARDLYRLPRYTVGDWNGDRFAAALATFC